MQEFQSIPGLAGRLFGGVADLRRAQAAQQGPPGTTRCGGVSPAPPEAVKCPRCESTNTKFCYYNNYNLSQPRHFCKSCRRYWTKGGVLRNVPVGGGCRKAKRSSSSSSSSGAASSAPSTPTSAADAAAKNPRRASASSPRSNSGSASPTAAAATAQTPTSNAATPSSNNIPFTSPFSTVDVTPPAPIFADQAAALASLFAPPLPPSLPVFSFAAAQQPKEEESAAAAASALQLAGQAAEAPASSSASADMTPFASLEDAAGMFDLGDASAASYWSAGSCWTDVHDPSMYLP